MLMLDGKCWLTVLAGLCLMAIMSNASLPHPNTLPLTPILTLFQLPTSAVQPHLTLPPDVAGGLTGFAVAKDLLKLDFSSPEEAPEEFRAVTFNAPPPKKGMRMPSLTALEIQTQGMAPSWLRAWNGAF